MGVLNNIKESYKHIPYTWKHYLAFLRVEKQCMGYYKYKFHDWDKLFMYTFLPFLGPENISRIHRKYSAHHPIYKEGHVIYYKAGYNIRWDETIIDWECARFTKPDKPMNAFQTLHTNAHTQYIDYGTPVLRDLHL